MAPTWVVAPPGGAPGWGMPMPPVLGAGYPPGAFMAAPPHPGMGPQVVMQPTYFLPRGAPMPMPMPVQRVPAVPGVPTMPNSSGERWGGC